jgi:hypothetical protein
MGGSVEEDRMDDHQYHVSSSAQVDDPVITDASINKRRLRLPERFPFKLNRKALYFLSSGRIF